MVGAGCVFKDGGDAAIFRLRYYGTSSLCRRKRKGGVPLSDVGVRMGVRCVV